jgi:Zn-dependent protease
MVQRRYRIDIQMQLPFAGRSLSEWIALAIILFISFPVHELAHALTADRFGDRTPSMNGRLTLNPVAHWDLMGTLLLIVTGSFGWAKPVPIDPYALSRRSPAAVMWVSLAGPVSNFLLALVAAIPIRLGWVSLFSTGSATGVSVFSVLIDFIYINLALMLFNLIPLPPLDGDKVAEYFYPPSWSRVMDRVRQYGPMALLIILFVLPIIGIDVLGPVIGPPLTALTRLLTGL